MATRHHPRAAAAQQPANRGVAPAGKQKAVGAAAGRPDARNRQALGDIGNVMNAHVVDGKIQLPEGINRPITRSFGAQLLKKAQENAGAANKIVAQNPARKEPALKPAKKLVPRPENAATKVSENNKKPVEAKKPPPPAAEVVGSSSGGGGAHKYSRKKMVNTLTSVLTARSKYACGINDRPKELVEDIDKLDGDNQLAVVDYIEDIYKFYSTAQHEYRPIDYMSSQLEVNPKMRAILADWITEVHYKFELMPETLYLTVYIIDRFLSLQPVLRRELQLVGVAAMLIACKYEEIWAPDVNDFICIADNAYSRHQILAMEKNILNRMQWNLTVPTPYVFLVRFIKAAGGDKELENMVFFFSEMALKEYGMASLCPSLVAASAVYAAQLTLKKSPLWTNTLKHHTGFSESQLTECAKVLVNAHAEAPESKLRIAYKKYSSEQFGRVSLHAPAVGLLIRDATWAAVGEEFTDGWVTQHLQLVHPRHDHAGADEVAGGEQVSHAEHEYRPNDYMSSQLEVNPKMRAILADWTTEVHYKFELMPETLHLTMYIIDRFLSLQPVLRRELQLVGVAAMLISCKYEEIWAPDLSQKKNSYYVLNIDFICVVNDFICIADNAYSRHQILAMEKNILNRMQCNLTVPTPYVFLVRFIKAAGGDKELENMVFFFSEMALKEYGMASLCPSLVAASAVYAAQLTLKKSPLWTNTLKHHTGFSESQECAKVLVNAHAEAPENKLKIAYKYSTEQFGRVSLHAPAVGQVWIFTSLGSV
uniref:Uncharacterized protein n=1 Tax=Leersia perrieri TaxID=77586 RepID=A0A0D9WI43_9ORYZ